MNEKFNKNAILEQLTKVVLSYGEEKGLIVKDPYFKITRSARQGCPISPLLYILQIEPLACTLRKDKEVKGIILPNNSEVKVSMFADDTQLFLKDELSIINSMNILSTFEEASGSKINLRKTIGIYIGGWKNKNPEYTNITWSKTCVKTLRIYHVLSIMTLYGKKN